MPLWTLSHASEESVTTTDTFLFYVKITWPIRADNESLWIRSVAATDLTPLQIFNHGAQVDRHRFWTEQRESSTWNCGEEVGINTNGLSLDGGSWGTGRTLFSLFGVWPCARKRWAERSFVRNFMYHRNGYFHYATVCAFLLIVA